MRHRKAGSWMLGFSLLGLGLLLGCPAREQGAEPDSAVSGAGSNGKAGAADRTAASGGQEAEVSSTEDGAGAAAEGPAGVTGGNETLAQKDGGLQGQRALALPQSLKLDISNGEVVIVPLAAGAEPEALWTILPAKGVKPAPIDSLKLVFSEDAGVLTLKDDYSGPQLAQRPQLKLTLSLPIDSAVNASLGNGALSIESNGKLQARVGNGSLTLKGECPSSDAEVGNGSIKADMLLLLGDHKLKVGNGGVKLKLDSGSSVSYSASTNIGTISLGGLPGTVTKEMMNQKASGSLGAGAASLKIEVGNGGVNLSS